MNDLSKQQLILLALLVSFVTSLATGVITVSLMDQAPTGVSQTITQVIEKTIQQVVPQDAAVGTIATSTGDQIAASVKKVAASVVKLKSKNGAEIAGIGLIVSPSGVILSNKPSVAGLTDYVAVFADGTSVPVSIIQSQIQGDIVFLAPTVRWPGKVYPSISFTNNTSLGETVLSLSETSTAVLSQGIITSEPDASSTYVGTSINELRVVPGSPLFDINGLVTGVRTSADNDNSGATFYSLHELQAVIPVVR